MSEPDAPATRKAAPKRAGKFSEGMALSLSGGGFRAMLFHVGALWRLNQSGMLPKLERISSMSGGSITSALLGLRWGEMEFDASGVAHAFERRIVEPIRSFANKTIDVGAVIVGALSPTSTIGDRIASAYREHLYGEATLQDLPADSEGPRFVINATNVQAGSLWRFSRPYMWDYQVGKVARPRVPLAVAVGASSAFPPMLSPVILDLDPALFTPNTGDTLQREPYTSRVHLTDGGVYDNLGIETTLKSFRTILVSDGGGKIDAEPEPRRNWAHHFHRVTGMIDDQVRNLRKRSLMAAYRAKPEGREYRKGAYWSIRADLARYPRRGPMDCPFERTTLLADVATRLARLDQLTQERLINWGYAACDGALRSFVPEAGPVEAAFPYPVSRV